MLQDLKFAWRRLRLAPGPALFAVATLTIGIGVATATYSIVETALWRPMGITDESRVSVLSRSNMPRSAPILVSLDDAQRLGKARDRLGLLSTAGWRAFDATVVGHGVGALANGEFVTPEYFTTLGVHPQVGRLFEPGDATSGVAVLSDSAWRTQFDADPHAVGASIKVANQPFTVIGVAPAGFRGVHEESLTYPSVWLPLLSAPAVTAAAGWPVPPTSLTLAVRLAPGHSTKEVADAITAFGLSLDSSAPLPARRFADGSSQPQPRYWTTIATTDDANYDQGSEFGRVIIALPGLVLLIACTNIANLVLSRGASRRQDFGVRRALGASRWQLVREQLVEQGLVAVMGGLGAVAVAEWLIGATARLVQTTLAPFVSGAPIDWHLHGGVWPATIFGIGLSLLVCGVIPALHLTRESLRTVLAQGDAASTPRWRGRGNLIALQLGVSVGLFLIALIFVNIVIGHPEAAPARGAVVAADARVEAMGMVPFTGQGRDADFERAYVDRALTTLVASPDVEAAAVTTAGSSVPGLEDAVWSSAFRTSADAETIGAKPLDRRSFHFAAVSPNYFAAVGLPLVYGRSFAATEANAIVVNEGLALDVFGTANAVGRTLPITIHDRLMGDTPAEQRPIIVGVVPGLRLQRQSRQHDNIVYAPFALHVSPTVTLVARGHAGAPAPTRALSRALAAADPEVAVSFVSTAEVVARGPLAFAGYIATSLATLAFLALGMATVGLYGVLSHVMARRTREIGIRVALGATPRAITALVLRGGFRPILEGLFIGLATAAVIRYFMLRTMVQESVGSLDPIAVISSFVLLGAAGAAACWLPARRATRVSPMTALRTL